MLNRVRLIGHLGSDPETLQTRNSGADYARLSLATSENWRDKTSGERRTATEWHKVVIWNEKLVDVVRQYLKKGSKVYIEGKLTTRKWTDKNGIVRYTSEIVLQGFGAALVMLDRREGDRPPEPEEPYGFGAEDYQAARDGETAHAELNDEIPF